MANLNDLFCGYYEPTADDLSALWGEGVFVIDANVLLQLYDLPERTREETLSALEKLGGRIWIPYQVAVEYQRNRIKSIGQARENDVKVVEPLEKALNDFINAVNMVKLEKRGLDSAATKMHTIIEYGKNVIEDAKGALASQVDFQGGDAIRDSLSRLFAERIGEAPTQATLDQWYSEAKARYEHKMGPGHEDSDKKNPTFKHSGVIYNRFYGDYVLWRQTIERFKDDDSVRGVVIITNDKKVDWWQKHNGKVAGPQPELCHEMRSEANIDRFWMYDLEDFLLESKVRLQAQVSETTLSDVASATATEVVRALLWNKGLAASANAYRTERRQLSAALSLMGVDVQIGGAGFSAGPVPRYDGTWAIAFTPPSIRQVMAENEFRWLLSDMYKRGARTIQIYCLSSNYAEHDPYLPIEEFSDAIDADFFEETVDLHYYVGNFDGDVQLVRMGRT